MTFLRVSLTNADSGYWQAGAQFVPGPAPPARFGYTYQAGHLTVHESSTTPLALRAAQEEGRPCQETWLVNELPRGIRKLDLSDCCREFQLRKAA